MTSRTVTTSSAAPSVHNGNQTCPCTPQLFRQNPYKAIPRRPTDHRSNQMAAQRTSHLLRLSTLIQQPHFPPDMYWLEATVCRLLHPRMERSLARFPCPSEHHVQEILRFIVDYRSYSEYLESAVLQLGS